MEPLVSVIIPVYNVKDYLTECVESVLNQTYKKMEIILVDDGATDGSGELCDDFLSVDSRIRVLHKANGGLSDARNEGVKLSTGDIISFIDSDDYVSALFIEEMVSNMLETGSDIAVLKGGTDFWDGDALPKLNTTTVKKGRKISAHSALKEQLCHCNATGAQFKIYKKHILNGVEFPKGYLYEDVATTYKYFMNAESVVIIDDDLYAYRKRKNSIIRKGFKEDKMVCLTIADQVLRDVIQYDPDLRDAAISRVYSMVYSVFLQIPDDDLKHQKELWDWMKKYRFSIVTSRDGMIRKKNRYGAIASYLGRNFSRYLGHKFGQKGSMGN